MKKRYLSFAMAVCMICCLTMTSCLAADIPAANSGTAMENRALLSETQGGFPFFESLKNAQQVMTAPGKIRFNTVSVPQADPGQVLLKSLSNMR